MAGVLSPEEEADQLVNTFMGDAWRADFRDAIARALQDHADAARHEEREACAAPDLLAALEGIVEAAAARFDEYGDGEAEPALRAARAALRRAQGGPPLDAEILAAFEARGWSRSSDNGLFADLEEGRFLARPNEEGSVTLYRMRDTAEDKERILWTREQADGWLDAWGP